jgi:hypothetical protein
MTTWTSHDSPISKILKLNFLSFQLPRVEKCHSHVFPVINGKGSEKKIDWISKG